MKRRTSGNLKMIMGMKKTLFICAAALLAAVACNKDIVDNTAPAGSVVLKATMETVETKVGATVNEDTKKVAFTWTKGDAVAVQTASGFANFTLSGNGGAATGEFSGDATPVQGGVAVSPAAVAGAVAGGNLTVNLPASYNYAAGQTNALLYAAVDGDKMCFTHLGGLVSVELKGVPAGAKFVLTAEGQKINGAYTVDCSAEVPQINVAATENAAESTVTVNFAEAVVEATVYVPVPAGEYTALKAQVLAADDTVLKQISATSTKTVGRKVVKAMPYIIVALKDVFVSPEGAGDKSGTSWDNAMDQAAFNKYINYDVHGSNYTKGECDAFNGTKIYFKEGKYTFLAHSGSKDRFKLQFTNAGQPCYIEFYGGYAASSTGTDLTKRNVAQYVTKLTGDLNNNDQADRAEDQGIFCVDNWAFLTFDGITFTCAGGKNVGGNTIYRQGAFVANSDKDKFSLTFKNCNFKDLISSDYADSNGYKKGCGSAIFAMKNGTINIDNCNFENCIGHHVGGCICLSAATTTLNVTNTTFKNCVSENTHGGAISSGEGAPFTVKNCTFDSCSAYSQGGALYGNKAAIVNIEGCTFTKCSTVQTSGGKGAAIAMDATSSPVANVKNCVFDACEAKDQGAAVALQKNAVAKLDGCVVKNCITRNRGAFRLESESVLFLNNCAVYDCKTTGDWGAAMASSGGHFLINNCVFENNTVGNKGAILNGSGAWAIINSTITSATELASGNSNATIRWDSGKASLLMNSMFFYTGSQTDADDAAIYLTSATNTMNNGGYNVYSSATNMAAAATDKVGSLPSAYGLTWNTDHFIWNGLAADASKATLAEIEEALKTKVSYATGSFTNLGLDFYNWLQEIGGGKNPLAYDQKGNARNTAAMWPGAYEKN